MPDLDRLLDEVARAAPGGRRIRHWSVYASETRRLSLGTKDRQTGNAHAPLTIAESAGARYLLVWDDGLVSRGHLERRQIERDAAEALVLARQSAYEDEDAAQVCGPTRIPDVVLHDDGAARLVSGETGPLESRLGAVRGQLSFCGFRTWSGSFSATEGTARLATSAGLDATGKGTSFGWHVTYEGEWGDGFSARALESQNEFDARLEKLAETVRLLKRPAEPMRPGVRPVILHPHVVDGFVLPTILHNLSGSNVAHGESFYEKAQFGSAQPVFREDLSLRLDPLRPLRSGSYRFTSEGVPAARHTYVSQGRLVSPILDLKYAKRLGMEPTPVPYGTDALDLEAEETLDPADAFVAAEGGAIVLSVLGVHTQDPSSGDFSLSAPQALRIGPGGPEGRIRATLSGNLFEILRSEEFRLVRFEGEHSPGLLLRTRLDPS